MYVDLKYEDFCLLVDWVCECVCGVSFVDVLLVMGCFVGDGLLCW